MVLSKPKTILIVDDEPDTAEMYAEMLRLSGYRVIKSYGGAAAMGLLSKEGPDAMVLDLMMPDISGIEVLHRIRNNPSWQKLPVIVISAKCMPKDIQDGMEAGASAYLTKPVTFLELQKTVNATIGLRG